MSARYALAVGWVTPAGYGYTAASDPEAHASLLSMDASDPAEILWAAEWSERTLGLNARLGEPFDPEPIE